MNISWKIDENSKKLRDVTQYKYNLEIKDNNNIYKYEGKETNIEIRGLVNNKEYEFRVRTIYKESYGNWSEYKKVQILNGYNSFKSNPLEKEEKNVNIEVVGVELNKNNLFQNNNPFYNNSLFGPNTNQNKNFISWKKIN